MPKIVGTGVAARILGVSPERVRQLVHEGKLRSQRVGWQHVFRLSDVERLAAKRAAQARADRRVSTP